MAKKILKICLIIAATLLAIAVLFFIWTSIRIQRGDLVKWDNHWYTKEDLRAKYPPQVIEVPAKNTPEEVYVKFRQALLDDDIEGALGLMREEKREAYRIAFEDKTKLGLWVKTLPKEIGNLRINGNFAYYDWDKADGYKHTIDFLKNFDGNWEIDSI